jgi:acyl-CoA dehydrogenase
MSSATEAADARYAHLTSDQLVLLEATHSLAAHVLAEIAAQGQERHINRPLVAALAEHGLLGRLFRRSGDEFVDTSAMDLCLIREGLARGSTEAETAFALQGLGAYPILQAGPRELVDAWIPRVAAGEAVAAFALTEPEAGSDVASMALVAMATGSGSRARRSSSRTRPTRTSIRCSHALPRVPARVASPRSRCRPTRRA